jgi:hypothetical protein
MSRRAGTRRKEEFCDPDSISAGLDWAGKAIKALPGSRDQQQRPGQQVTNTPRTWDGFGAAGRSRWCWSEAECWCLGLEWVVRVLGPHVHHLCWRYHRVCW